MDGSAGSFPSPRLVDGMEGMENQRDKKDVK
jgi:hypothetical protein